MKNISQISTSKILMLGIFVALFCLPAIIFGSMRASAQVDPSLGIIGDLPALCNVINYFGGSAVVTCDTQKSKTNFPFQINKCYQLDFDIEGKVAAVTEKNCVEPPFGSSKTTVRCDDGTVVNGNSNQTAEQICAKNGGYTPPPPPSTAPELDEVVNNTERDDVLKCNGDRNKGGNLADCFAANPIVGLVQVAVNFLGVGAGIIITIMIVIGGIQYSAAGSDPQKVAAAKERILNAIIALFCLIFLYSFLQWLVPGGVF